MRCQILKGGLGISSYPRLDRLSKPMEFRDDVGGFTRPGALVVVRLISQVQPLRQLFKRIRDEAIYSNFASGRVSLDYWGIDEEDPGSYL